MKELMALALITLASLGAYGWDDHDMLTLFSLGGQDYAGELVEAERLGDFLEAEKSALAPFLDELEKGAGAAIRQLPARPVPLALDSRLSGYELTIAFLKAIRVNPTLPFLLFIQPAAGAPRNLRHMPLPVKAVDIFDARFPNQPFESIVAGEQVPVLSVLSSASDEPDYGLDIGLYEDNRTNYGATYGLGTQPFGNPALLYGSQAPFHMSFPWEDPVIKAAAPFVGRGLAEYRVTQFTELARFAFRSGHAYWGWRFAGWALHYLQDMAQPYHARLMPGKGTVGMLSLYALGSPDDIAGAVVLLSNRHLLFEDYFYRLLSTHYMDESSSPAFAAMRTGTGKPVAYRERFAYDVAAKASHDRGAALDKLLVESFPLHYTSDPSYDYGADPKKTGYDSLATLRETAPAQAKALEAAATAIFADMGDYARSYIAYVRDATASLPPRKTPVDMRGVLYISAITALAAVLVYLLAMLAARPRRRRS